MAYREDLLGTMEGHPSRRSPRGRFAAGPFDSACTRASLNELRAGAAPTMSAAPTSSRSSERRRGATVIRRRRCNGRAAAGRTNSSGRARRSARFSSETGTSRCPSPTSVVRGRHHVRSTHPRSIAAERGVVHLISAGEREGRALPDRRSCRSSSSRERPERQRRAERTGRRSAANVSRACRTDWADSSVGRAADF